MITISTNLDSITLQFPSSAHFYYLNTIKIVDTDKLDSAVCNLETTFIKIYIPFQKVE